MSNPRHSSRIQSAAYRKPPSAFPVILASFLALGLASAAVRDTKSPPDFATLEAKLEKLRVRWNVPGMAAGSDQLLKPATKRLAFAPATTAKGKALPYGMGWFVQPHRGVTLLWHYGWDRANSSLIIKVPEREVTCVLLGNSEALSRKFDLGRDADVTQSPFAREFLRSVGL